MKEKEITVTVTQVGHPLQKNVVSKTSTIGVYTKNKYFVFEDSPLSMLVRKGDVLHLSSSRDLLEIKNIEASFQETKSFHGRVERISQPFWYRTKETGLKDWYIILLAERNLIPIRAKNWNILLLRDGDEISLDLRQDKPLNFENKSLGFKFTSSLKPSSDLKGKIKRASLPTMWPNAQGIMELQILILMEDMRFKILPATPESMFLEDGDIVEISDDGIKNSRIPQVRFCGSALPEYFEVKCIGHPLPVHFSNGITQFGRYLITTEDEMYLIPANGYNSLIHAGDKIFNY